MDTEPPEEKKRAAAEARVECSRCHAAKRIQTEHHLDEMTAVQRWAWLEQNLGLNLRGWKITPDKDGKRKVVCNACASKPGKLPDAHAFNCPCPMCASMDQKVRYIGEPARSARTRKKLDSHLKVTCDRCGYLFITETAKDAKGQDDE